MRGVRFADLLQRQHIGEGIHTCAAVFLRDLDPHKAHLTHFPDGRLREFPALIELSCDGRDLVLREITSGITDHFVLFAEGKQSNIWHSSSNGWFPEIIPPR
jgi:hypothetical protein